MRKIFSGIVFDMDGVLIDSETIVKTSGQAAAKLFGAELSDALYNNLMGLPAKEVENGLRQAFGPDFPMQQFRSELELLWHEHVQSHGMPVKPGIERVLDALLDNGIPFAIATSTPTERAEFSLATAGIHQYFDVIVGGDQVASGKPAPDIFLAAAEKILVKPTSCIAFEDSAIGVKAASSAGMYTIMIPDQKAPDAATKRRFNEMFLSMPAASTRLFELLGLSDA